MHVEHRLVEALRPHPLNAEIYGDEADDELVSRVQMLGIIHPLLITADNTVISGHRRLDAARRLGLVEVPVLVSPLSDPLEVEELLIEANRQRQPSNEQRVREYRHLKALRLQRAGARGPRPNLYPPRVVVEGGGAVGVPPPAEDAEPQRVREPGPPPNRPAAPILNGPAPDEEGVDRKVARQARAEAALLVGGNANVLERGARVVEHIDALEHAELRDEASDLRQLLNRRSVAAAWRKITEPEVPEVTPADLPPVARMGKVADEADQWVLRNLDHPLADKVQHAVEALRAVVELFGEEAP